MIHPSEAEKAAVPSAPAAAAAAAVSSTATPRPSPAAAAAAGKGSGAARVWLDEVTTGLGFAALREEWTDLLRSASGASPFLSWAWLYPWWRRVAPEAQPRVLTARDGDGRLVGVLPLCETVQRRGWGPAATVRWGFLGDSWVGSDYLDVLAAPGREEELAELFAEHLAAKAGRFDVLELLDLPQGSVFGTRVVERLMPGALKAERTSRYLCPFIDLQGTTYEAYLRAVGRADNLARRKKWLLAQPGYAIDRVEEPRGLPGAMADFFRLHDLRWEKDGGSQGIRGPRLRAFHRDATVLLSQDGMLRMYTLRIGDRALASVYGIRLGDHFYYYQSGYDPEWARRSVGLVLLGETIADAFREGRRVFDFLRGSEPYKLEWSNGRRHTEAVRLVRRTAGGLAHLAATDGVRALKDGVKRAAGQKAWSGLQRWRRARQGA